MAAARGIVCVCSTSYGDQIIWVAVPGRIAIGYVFPPAAEATTVSEVGVACGDRDEGKGDRWAKGPGVSSVRAQQRMGGTGCG